MTREEREQFLAAVHVGVLTGLVVWPDGHVGLRADRNHLEALAAYHALLAFGRTSP